MSHEEMSFCELRSKEIVNEVDGRKLGRACDLVFSPKTGCVLGIVAPYNKKSFFFKGQEIYIPFKHIVKIGPDVVLVRLTSDLSHPDTCVDMGRGGRGGRGNGGRGGGGGGRVPPRYSDEKYGRHGGHGGDGHDGHDDDCDEDECDESEISARAINQGQMQGSFVPQGNQFTQSSQFAQNNQFIPQGGQYMPQGGQFGNAQFAPQGAFSAPDTSTQGSCDFKCEKCMLFDCSRRWKGGVNQSSYYDSPNA